MDKSDIDTLRGAAAASTLYGGRSGDTPFTTALKLSNVYGLTKAPSWAIASLERGEKLHGSDFQRMTREAVAGGLKSYASTALTTAIAGATPGIGQALLAGAAARAATEYVIQPIFEALTEPDVPVQPSWVYPYLDSYRAALYRATSFGVPVPPEYLPSSRGVQDEFLFIASMSEGEAGGLISALADYVESEIAIASALRAREEHERNTPWDSEGVLAEDFDLSSYGIDPSRIKHDPSTGKPYAVRGSRGTVLITPQMNLHTFNQLWNNYS